MKKLWLSAFLLLLISFILYSQTSDSAAAPQLKTETTESILHDWHFVPGDAIMITTTPDTGFPNGIYPVYGDGFVDLPMIGPLQVTKMSRAEFEEKVKEVYIPLLRYSSILVRRVISISFQGGFQRPGVYWVSPGATLWYALSLCGSTIREDGLRKIKWERNGELMEQRVIDLLNTPKPMSELGIRSGDVMRVINRQKRTGWDVFRQDVLPLISFGLSTAVTAITLYEWSQK